MVFTIDADIHVNDTPGKLAPYCDMPWRKSLELLDGASTALRWLTYRYVSSSLRTTAFTSF